MNNKPLLSVVMTIYKDAKHLKEAIESILNQTFSDFEFIIVNEFGYDDGSIDIINSFSDSRIKIVQNDKKEGFWASLNKGMKLAKGKYIARMDGDDISHLDRFQKEIDYLENNPDTGIVSSWYRFFGNAEYDYCGETDDEQLKSDTIFYCHLSHGSNIYRRDVIEKYDLYYRNVAIEDHDLYSRAVLCTKMHIIPEVLLDYRSSDENITNEKYEVIQEASIDIAEYFFNLFDIKIPKHLRGCFRSWDCNYLMSIKDDKKLKNIIKDLEKLFIKLEKANIKKKIFNPKNLKRTLRRKWREIFKIKMNSRYLFYLSARYGAKPLKTLLFNKPEQPKIFLFGTSRHDNIGDAAIGLAIVKFARKYFSKYKLIEIPTYEFDENLDYIKNNIGYKDMVWCAGGGNLGNRYIDEELLRRKAVAYFKNNDAFIFPQSIYFTDDEEGKSEIAKSKRDYEKNKYLTIFTRDPLSLKYAKEYFPNTKSALFPDIVCSYPYKKNFKRKGILCCIRDIDDESGLTKEQYDKFMQILKEYGLPVDYTVNRHPDPVVSELMRPEVVNNQLDNFARHRVVVTDRLHGLIFSIVTKTPCVVIKSHDHKIREFMHFLKDSNAVLFIDRNTDELKSAIDNMLKVKKTAYPNWKEYFTALKKYIKERYKYYECN